MISVIIPVLNNNVQLDLTLNGFANQSLSPELFEIWIVDDGSNPPAEAIVQKYLSRIPNINYVYQNNLGRASARNRPRDMIKGSIVLFNDSDRIPGPAFLMTHYDFHMLQDDAVAIGNVKEIYFSDLIGNQELICKIVNENSRGAKQIEVHKTFYQIYDHMGMTDASIRWLTTFSGNMSLPLKFLNKLGWFDENFYDWGFEHFELGYRFVQAGIPYKYLKEANNFHLAHVREEGALMAAMERSHQYFLKKHPSVEIEKLLDVMKGSVSLQQYELLSQRGKSRAAFLDAIQEPLLIGVKN